VLLVASFSGNFWPNFSASLLASLVVVVVAYFFVERRLHLRQNREEKEQELVRRWEIAWEALRAVEEELEHNSQQAELILGHAGDEELPYPAFKTNGWDLISQSEVFTALSEGTLRRLLRAYNRFRAANEFYSKTHDFLFGRTAVLAVGAIEGLGDDMARTGHHMKFTEQRVAMLKQLMEKLVELQPHLDEARDRVRLELAKPPPGVDLPISKER
jgi:hypothetical protein